MARYSVMKEATTTTVGPPTTIHMMGCFHHGPECGATAGEEGRVLIDAYLGTMKTDFSRTAPTPGACTLK